MVSSPQAPLCEIHRAERPYPRTKWPQIGLHDRHGGPSKALTPGLRALERAQRKPFSSSCTPSQYHPPTDIQPNGHKRAALEALAAKCAPGSRR